MPVNTPRQLPQCMVEGMAGSSSILDIACAASALVDANHSVHMTQSCCCCATCHSQA